MAVSSCMKADGTVEDLRIWIQSVPLMFPILVHCNPPGLFQPTASSDDMTLTSPSMDNSSAELLPSGDSPLNKRMTENLLASLSEHERAAILNVPAAQNPEDLRMFARWEQMTEWDMNNCAWEHWCPCTAHSEVVCAEQKLVSGCVGMQVVARPWVSRAASSSLPERQLLLNSHQLGRNVAWFLVLRESLGPCISALLSVTSILP